MDTNECYVYFALDGEDFEPNDVTDYLNIKPTSVRRKGERVAGIIHRSSSWKLSTQKIINEIIYVDEMASEVIKILKPKINQINEIAEKLNLSARLEVVLWITTDDTQTTPAISFNVNNLKFLSNVNAYIDIDTYRN
ncbi:DUF4279 domain-containing protein [Oscillatoria salina]|uniref:DUF4279 domain-containing protein n=1 Tax=Oscillatoria salina TaxID=331517 RepID=UPI001CCB4F9E|nr:DUF4279 domain-containing protein [Oscillatoria salina]MBZ8182596.1 DUF4279 domain-containing protein [Oscillatoria salina IIICB1]